MVFPLHVLQKYDLLWTKKFKSVSGKKVTEQDRGLMRETFIRATFSPTGFLPH